MSSSMFRRVPLPDGPLGRGYEWFAELPQHVRSIMRSSPARAWVQSAREDALLLDVRQLGHRFLDALLTGVILGGVLAVPVASVLAVLGVVLPVPAPLRDTGAQLFGIAALWFVGAVLCAHVVPKRNVSGTQAH